MREISFATSQEAWEGVNKMLVNTTEPADDVVIYKNLVFYFDLMIRIKKSVIDPEFDFTRTVNYRKAKWTSLVGNYVDKNHLEEVVAAVHYRERKKDKNYNETFHFGNSHSHGKGCLLVCTFTRRNGVDGPMLNAVMRASEFYKRGMMDLMLLHRIGEQAYGEESFSVNLFAQQLWGGADWLSLIFAWDPDFIREAKSGGLFAREVYKNFRKFMDEEKIEELRYHAYKRACYVIQDNTAKPALLAQHCELY